MGDYHDHYLKKDVLLLFDVFGKFINTCLTLYRLGLCHYSIFLGLSRDAMLKISAVKSEKILNIDINLFLENGLREGIHYIVKRYEKASNKDMKNYDPTKPSKFITYLDVNSLYG